MGDIEDQDFALVAKALVTMFEDEAPEKIRERSEHYCAQGSEKGVKFWERVLEEVQEVLQAPEWLQ